MSFRSKANSVSKDSRPLLHGGEVTGYHMLRSVKWEAHRGLMNSIPTMLRHLREDGMSNPTLFLRRDHAIELLAGDLLRSFFNNLSKTNEMSVRKTREICAWRAPHVLACAISNVLEFSAQPLIPTETCLRLLAVSGALRPSAPEKRIEMVSEILEEMPAWRFELLASFVSFLRDCASPNADLARELGPLMLLRDGVSLAPPVSRGRKIPEIVREQNQVNDEMAASETFKVMIDECSALFGIVSGYDPHRVVHKPLRHNETGGGGYGVIGGRGHEGKHMHDEEKSSHSSSLNSLYEGVSVSTVPRKKKTKKASHFHAIIARTSSNVSRGSLTDEPDSPVSILKVGSNSQLRRGGGEPTTTMKEVPQPAPVKPAKPAAMLEQNINESSNYHAKRPPPVQTTIMKRASLDSPLIQTKSSFPISSPANTVKNPVIKTQTSFNNSSRPSTPTSILEARRKMLADIQAGSGQFQPISPLPPTFMEEKKNSTADEVLRPVAISPSPPVQQTKDERQLEQSTESAFKATSSSSKIEATTILSTALVVNSVQQQQETINSEEMDADGPTIFEREMQGGLDATKGRGAVVASNNAGRTSPPPVKKLSEFESRRPTLTIDTARAEEEEEKAEHPASSPEPVVESAPPAKPAKPPKPPKKPDEPRHSFIPRVTSPRRSLQETQKDQQPAPIFSTSSGRRNSIDIDAELVSDPSRSSSMDERGASSQPGSPALFFLTGQTNPHFAEQLAARQAAKEQQKEQTPSSSPVPVPSKKPRASFAEQLAARRAAVEQVDEKKPVSSQPSSPTPPSTTTTTTHPKQPRPSFAEQLAARRAVVEQPNEQQQQQQQQQQQPVAKPAPPPGPKPRPSFAEQLAARRASVDESSEQKPAPPPASKPRPSFAEQLAARRASVDHSTEQQRAKPVVVSSTKPRPSFAEQLAARRASVDQSSEQPSSPVVVSSTKPRPSFAEQLAARRSVVETSGVVVEGAKSSAPVGGGAPKTFEEQLAQFRAEIEAEEGNGGIKMEDDEEEEASPAKPPKPTEPRPSRKSFQEAMADRRAQSEGAAATTTATATAATAKPDTKAPPPQPRPKPVPPPLTPAVQEIRTEVMTKRASLVMMVPPPVAVTTTQPPAPEPAAVDDKLANLRALLKSSNAAGSGTVTPPTPQPPPEDTKKRVPPPGDAPPPGQMRIEKDPGMQIVGDWRTEYSPQHKALFWVNILTGAVQWGHPMRERSLSTKAREAQRKQYAVEVTGVTVKMPEQRKTIHENEDEEQPPLVAAAAVAASRYNQRKAEKRASLTLNPPRPSLVPVPARASVVVETEEQLIMAAKAQGELVAECVFDFSPQDPNNKAEMPIRVGEKLRIHERGSDGWWGGSRLRDPRQKGLFPEAYVKLI